MLLRCLELKEPIKRFNRQLRDDVLNDNVDYSPLTDRLSEDDWDDVKELVNFLQAPYEMTKRLKGNNSQSGFGSLWQTLPNLQALWVHYSNTKERPLSQYMASAVFLGGRSSTLTFTLLSWSLTLATTLSPPSSTRGSASTGSKTSGKTTHHGTAKRKSRSRRSSRSTSLLRLRLMTPKTHCSSFHLDGSSHLTVTAGTSTSVRWLLTYTSSLMPRTSASGKLGRWRSTLSHS
jgi:hypothetical protein